MHSLSQSALCRYLLCLTDDLLLDYYWFILVVQFVVQHEHFYTEDFSTSMAMTPVGTAYDASIA